MTDLYLKFPAEAEAMAALFVTEPATKPVLVQDAALESELDQLPLADAETDQTVQHNGKTYMADAGQWYELVEYAKPVQPLYQMTIDIIGTIYKPTGVMLDEDTPEMAAVDGWHVNTRGEAPEELLPYSINPTQPVRVWA